MANNKDLVSKEILQKATQDILQTVVDHLYEYEEYTDGEISDLFDLTPEEVKSISEIINDEVISKYKIWSSKGTSDKIDSAKIECQDYANNLIKNISSIELEWCETTLPTTGESNKIYILPKTVDSNTVNTLNIWNISSNSYVTIGNLEVDLTQYFTKDEINTMLTDYAKKSEVLPMDSVINDTSTASGTNVLSASASVNELNKKIDKTSIATTMSTTPTDEKVLSEKAVKTELDLKANDDEVVKKTDTTTTIGNTSTDSELPTAKAVYNLVGNENRRGYIYNNPTYRGNTWNRVFKVNSLLYCNSGFLTVTVYSSGLCQIATFLMSKNFNRLNIKQINCGGYNGDKGQSRPIKVRIIGCEHGNDSFLEIYVSGTTSTNVVTTYMPLHCNSVEVLNEEGSIPDGMFACEMTSTHDTYDTAAYTSVLK